MLHDRTHLSLYSQTVTTRTGWEFWTSKQNGHSLRKNWRYDNISRLTEYSPQSQEFLPTVDHWKESDSQRPWQSAGFKGCYRRLPDMWPVEPHYPWTRLQFICPYMSLWSYRSDFELLAWLYHILLCDFCSHVCTQSSKKLIKIQLSIITFPLPQALAQLGVGCARLASGTEAFAKAAGSFDACQRILPPAELFYLLHVQAVWSPKKVFGCGFFFCFFFVG